MEIFTLRTCGRAIFVLIGVGLLLLSSLFAQPNNGNTCANATDVTGLLNATPSCINLVSFSSAGLNASGTAAPASCVDGGGNVTDKWLKLTVPASGRVTFRFITTPGFNSVVQAYTGTCGALTQLGSCSSGDQRSYTGLTPGSTLFFQVWDKNDNLTGNGTTEICLWEPIACSASETRITLVHENQDGFPEESFVSIVPSGNACGSGALYTGGNTTQVGCNGGGQQNATLAGNGFGAANGIFVNEFCVTTGSDLDVYYVDDFGDGGNLITLYAEDVVIGILEGTCDGNMINVTAAVPSLGLPTCSCGNATCQGGANTPHIGFASEGAFLGGCTAETIIPLTPPIELAPSATQAPFTVCLTFNNPIDNDGSSGGFISGYSLLYSTSGACSFSASDLDVYDDNCNPLDSTGVESDFGLFALFGDPAQIVGGATYTACFTYYDLTDNGTGECTVYRIIPAITTNPLIVLPLSELVFRGKQVGATNLLDWTVSDTEDLNYFQLERQTERDKVFQSLARIELAAGKKSYQFADTSPESGANLYRLKLVSLNGRIQYSNTLEIRFEPDGSTRIFPNPFSESLNLQIRGMEVPVNLRIFDQQGRLVSQFQPDEQGPELQQLNLQSLAPGIYFYRLQNGKQVFSGKIAKQ